MEGQVIELAYALDTFYFLVMGAFVMWMAAGFSMLEAGLVRSKSTVEILTKNIMKVSIEASETNYWKKYTGHDGLTFGINVFGKSAPYKDIYDHFKLSEQSIINNIKEKL